MKLLHLLFPLYIIQSCLAREFRVLVMLPYARGSFKFPFGRELAGAAVQIAIDDITAEALLAGDTLALDYGNSNCNVVTGLGTAADMLYNPSTNYSIIIGPQCSQACSHVARLAAYLNIPDFTGVCQDTEMLDKIQFKTLTRFLGTFTMVGKAVTGFMTFYEWDRLGIIAETHVDKIWLFSQGGVESESEPLDYNVATSIAIGSKDHVDKSPEQILDETALLSRVIVLAVRGDTLRKLMIHASTHGYLHDYLYICLFYYEQPNAFGDFSWKRNDANDTIAKDAYKYVVFIKYYTRESTALTAFDAKMRTESARLFAHNFAATDTVPYPAANLYEATYMYAVALKETLDAGGDPDNGTLVSQRLWGRTFPDSLTGDLAINTNGDREQGYTFNQVAHLHGTSDSWELKEIGRYFSHEAVYVPDVGRAIVWPAGEKPLDTPPCGYDGEFCPTMSAQDKILIGIGAAFGALVLIMICLIIGFFFYKSWVKKKQSEIIWRIYYNDILFSRGSCTSMSKLSLKSVGSSGGAGGQIFTKTGTFKGAMVAIKLFNDLSATEVMLEKNKNEYFQMTELNSKNVTNIIGICVDAPNYVVLTEYCAKGSLQDILENDSINLDVDFKVSLMQDLIRGLSYLFDSSLKHHGNLKSSNCVVDGRFTMKVTDFGPKAWLEKKERDPKDLLWTAPEVLRGNTLTHSQWQKADIYSMAIIFNEIVMRNGTFHVDDMDHTAEELLEHVRKGTDPPFRPHIHVDEKSGCTNNVLRMVTHAWDEDPTVRLSMKQVKAEMKEIVGPGAKNFIDSLLERMEQYANNLEAIVEERTGKYMAEKKRVEELLHTILPPSIADQLQSQGAVEPETFELVTILFTDIKGFTALSSESTPIQIVNFLNDLYVCFDSIIDEFDAYKVETIGDAYMVVSGLPNRNDDHFCQIADLTLALMVAVKTFKIRHRPEMSLLLRAGMHTGSCVAGVVGLKMPRYCLFGDTVNTSSRMESNGEALKIHVSGPTRDHLVSYNSGKKYDLEVRGTIPIKGKGDMTTYWLHGKENIAPEGEAAS